MLVDIVYLKLGLAYSVFRIAFSVFKSVARVVQGVMCSLSQIFHYTKKRFYKFSFDNDCTRLVLILSLIHPSN